MVRRRAKTESLDISELLRPTRGLDLDDSLPASRAAAYLGISRQELTLCRLKGIVPAHRLRDTTYAKWFYRVRDLEAIKVPSEADPAYLKKLVDAGSNELPVDIVKRLLGVGDIRLATIVRLRLLKDYSPESVRQYWVAMKRIGAARELKRRLTLRTAELRKAIRSLRKIAIRTKCRTCRKRVFEAHGPHTRRVPTDD